MAESIEYSVLPSPKRPEIAKTVISGAACRVLASVTDGWIAAEGYLGKRMA
jgi:hypothetical protein